MSSSFNLMPGAIKEHTQLLPPKRPITPEICSVYHATTELNAKNILNGKGIIPRSLLGIESRYTENPSNYECVYLTYSHGAFFAVSQNSDHDVLKSQTASMNGFANSAIIEIDGTKLDEMLFYPDEDYLEQTGKGKDSVSGNEKARTAYYRNEMFKHQSRWQDGFNAAGTIAYRGIIPVAAIKRVSYITWMPKNPQSCLSIFKIMAKYTNGDFNSVARFPYLGATHRELTELFFGDRKNVNGEKHNVKGCISVVKNPKYKK